MSLEQDISGIIRLIEDDFKSANDAEVSKRRWNVEAEWRKKFITLADGTQITPTSDNVEKLHDDALENHPEVWEKVWEEVEDETGHFGDFAEEIYFDLVDVYELDEEFPISEPFYNMIYDNLLIDPTSGKIVYKGLD